MVIDEKSRRRSSFELEHSVPVVLGDAQTWYFPKPWLEIQPCFRDGKVARVRSVLTYGQEMEDLIDAIRASVDDCGTISAIASLGAFMLGWNYELSDADLDTLFSFRSVEHMSAAWPTQVIDLATGQSGPKLSSDGNG